MEYVVYFLAGILQDFLFTVSLRYVSKEKAIHASATAFLDNFVSVGVLYSIISRLEGQRTVVAILLYSLGIACGTFLAMKFKFGMKTDSSDVAR